MIYLMIINYILEVNLSYHIASSETLSVKITNNIINEQSSFIVYEEIVSDDFKRCHDLKSFMLEKWKLKIFRR